METSTCFILMGCFIPTVLQFYLIKPNSALQNINISCASFAPQKQPFNCTLQVPTPDQVLSFVSATISVPPGVDFSLKMC
jgi:hypothetical protein